MQQPPSPSLLFTSKGSPYSVDDGKKASRFLRETTAELPPPTTSLTDDDERVVTVSSTTEGRASCWVTLTLSTGLDTLDAALHRLQACGEVLCVVEARSRVYHVLFHDSATAQRAVSFDGVEWGRTSTAANLPAAQLPAIIAATQRRPVNYRLQTSSAAGVTPDFSIWTYVISFVFSRV